MNLDSEANENVRSSSSVLVPLGDHESLFSPKGSEKNEDYAQEENEKAAVIQRMYRKKMEKRREQEEQNEKATLIQRKYKEKLEKRRLAEEAKERQTKTQKEEREEENEKAAMIQRMYRAKKTKQKLVEEKHRKGKLSISSFVWLVSEYRREWKSYYDPTNVSTEKEEAKQS